MGNKKTALTKGKGNQKLWKSVRIHCVQSVFIVLAFLLAGLNVQAYFNQDQQVSDGGFGAADSEKSILAVLSQSEETEVIYNDNLPIEENTQTGQTRGGGVADPVFSNESLASAQGFVAGAVTTSTEEQMETGNEELATVQGEALQKTISPDGDMPNSGETGERVIKYTVQPGDTMSSVASRFGVSTEVVYWENKSRGLYIDSTLKPGDELGIPLFGGVTHQVGKNDTIEEIAAAFKADVDDIVMYNDLNSEDDVQAGQILYIPGGQKGDPEKKPVPVAPESPTRYAYGDNRSYYSSDPGTPQTASGSLMWPTSSRRITTRFSYRHPAVDIITAGVCTNLPLYAADNGRVVISSYGYNGGYGNRLCIDHGNGIRTCHNHNNSNVAGVGQYVTKGQVVAYMGRTGRAYGSCAIHTHFEVIVNGHPVNPLNYIR